MWHYATSGALIILLGWIAVMFSDPVWLSISCLAALVCVDLLRSLGHTRYSSHWAASCGPLLCWGRLDTRAPRRIGPPVASRCYSKWIILAHFYYLLRNWRGILDALIVDTSQWLYKIFPDEFLLYYLPLQNKHSIFEHRLGEYFLLQVWHCQPLNSFHHITNRSWWEF